jgi:hypothetical protein
VIVLYQLTDRRRRRSGLLSVEADFARVSPVSSAAVSATALLEGSFGTLLERQDWLLGYAARLRPTPNVLQLREKSSGGN